MQTTTSSRAATARRPVQPLALDDLLTVQGLIDASRGLITMHTLRHQMRNRDENGLGRYCVWMGNKILVSRTGYEKWLGARAGAAKGEGSDRG